MVTIRIVTFVINFSYVLNVPKNAWYIQVVNDP